MGAAAACQYKMSRRGSMSLEALGFAVVLGVITIAAVVSLLGRRRSRHRSPR
jgi:hypothetical protein